MERKIGEIFKYNGEWYQCVIGYSCNDCAFSNDNCEERERITLKNKLTKEEVTGFCTSRLRSDVKSVIFKKLEKVGEPYTTFVDKTVQNYLLETAVSVPPKDVFTLINNEQRLIAIEIKQNKEDMEEKKFCEETSKANEVNMIFKIASKYINGGITYDEFGEAMRNWINGSEKDEHILKEFDLEAVKSGKPVCTRDGRKARIICFDVKGDKPIIALIENEIDERPCNYFANGRFYSNPNENNDADLMMLTEKRSGWVNVYKNQIHDTPESAVEGHRGTTDYIKTIRVEWEE